MYIFNLQQNNSHVHWTYIVFLPVKHYHCHSFHTMVQKGPSLLHPDLEKLLYTVCEKKKHLKKKTAKKIMIIYRLSQHIIPSDWADWKQITWIYWLKVLFILSNFKTCRLSISHPKMTETLQKHACMYCKVQDKFLHTKVQTKSSQMILWYYDSKLAHSVTILSLLTEFFVLCN